MESTTSVSPESKYFDFNFYLKWYAGPCPLIFVFTSNWMLVLVLWILFLPQMVCLTMSFDFGFYLKWYACPGPLPRYGWNRLGWKRFKKLETGWDVLWRAHMITALHCAEANESWNWSEMSLGWGLSKEIRPSASDTGHRFNNSVYDGNLWGNILKLNQTQFLIFELIPPSSFYLNQHVTLGWKGKI